MQECWSRCAGHRMVTTDGRHVQVLYPGIRADSCGPDFKDAVLSLDSCAAVRGDVELHLESGDWFRHGHHTDPSYDDVVLHVVGKDTVAAIPASARTARMPVALLSGPVVLPGLAMLPCAFLSGDESTLYRKLGRAGVARLLTRARTLAPRCVFEGCWQVMARRISRALGYSANSDIGEALGLRLCEPHLHSMLLRCTEAERRSIVLGVAGLLPSQRRRGGLYVAADSPEYEAHWRAVESKVCALDPLGWRLRGLYPNNSPVRRVAALADLWPHMEELAETIVDLVLRLADQPRRCARELEQRVRLHGSDYWRSHSDFGIATRKSDVIGAGKAREVVVNALLPYVAAVAVCRGNHSLLRSVMQLYAAYPPAPVNAVTGHMWRQLGARRMHATADVQQGLLHLFTAYCRHGRCRQCPLVNP